MSRRKKWVLPVGTAVIALLAIGGAIAYLERDWLIEQAIRHELADTATTGFANDPERMRVLLCGTGSPELKGAAAQACTMVSVGGKMFLFDAGDGATRSLVDSGVRIQDMEGIFITHYHSDHFNDLGMFINQSWIWGRTRPLEVVGPTGTVEVVNALNAAYRLDNSFRAANMPDLSAARTAAQAHPTEIVFAHGARTASVYDQNGIEINAVLVEHDPVKPALGYVVRYQGKKLFISGDTRVSPLTTPAMQDADLVVHEAYATGLVRRSIPVMRELGMTHSAMEAERTIDYHADTVELAKQAAAAHVKHLVLTHLTPYPDNFIKRYLFTMGMKQYYGGELTVGEDGMVITV